MKYFTLMFILFGILNARVTCSQFESWEEAQAYFDAKKTGYKNLDKDHDGEVCETMSHKSKNTEKYIIGIYNKNYRTGFGSMYNSLKACSRATKALKKRNKNNTYKCIKQSSL
jgi:hypothetical protein